MFDPTRDPDFFKLHYRQWSNRMRRGRVPADVQGFLLAVVVDTHLRGEAPTADVDTLAEVLTTGRRRAERALERLLAYGLVEIRNGRVISDQAIEDVQDRRNAREQKARAGRLGGIATARKRQNEG